MPNGSPKSPTAIRSGFGRRRRERGEIKTGDLVRINTDIGYFINKAWVTEGMKPGVVACSHHLGRWRRAQDATANRWAMNQVTINETEDGKWKMRVVDGIRPFKIRRSRHRSESSGQTAASIKTSPSPSIPTRSPECTAGTKKSASKKPTPKTNTAMFLSIQINQWRFTKNGSK